MSSKDFPSTIEEVTPEWLTQMLQNSGALPEGQIKSFDSELIGQGVGILGLLYRVTLNYSADSSKAPETLVVKLPVQHEHTRHLTRTFMFYEKEVGFYRDISTSSPLGTPECFAAFHDSESDDFVLVLEDLTGGEVHSQIDGCPIPQAEYAVKALAEHHAAFWDSSRFSEDLAWVPRGWDPPMPQGVQQGVADAWPICQEMFGDRISDRIRKVCERFPAVTTELMQYPEAGTTLSHGDFRLDNLFFNGSELTVIDWQICIRTRGAYDLGYFLSQSLTVEDRRAHEKSLIDLYQSTLALSGIDYSTDELMTDYRRAVLFCICYPIQSAGGIELVNERAVQLVNDMFDRVSIAIEDLDADELMP